MTALAYSPLAELLAGIGVTVETDLATAGEAAFSPDRRHRYALTRRWRGDTELLPWVMLNPSTADAFRLDPTVTRCAGFSRRQGAGGLLVLNLYAYRSTNPKALRDAADPIGELNDAVTVRVLAALHGTGRPVVCAWGANADPGRARRAVQLIRDAGHQPVCLGRTSSGQPRHPLYVAGKTPLEDL